MHQIKQNSISSSFSRSPRGNMQSLGRKHTAGYAGGVIGSGVNAKDYHKTVQKQDVLAMDSLDAGDSPMQNDSLLSTSKA